MSVKRDYICDFCKDTIADYRGGIGVKWMHGDLLRNVLISDSEHHLCNRCCKSLHEMFTQMGTPRTPLGGKA